MEQLEALKLVGDARSPEDLFGARDGDKQLARRSYRALSRLVYPDVPGGDVALFQKLNWMWQRWQGLSIVTITTKRHRHAVTSEVVRGDLANLYYGSYPSTSTPGAERPTLVKMARSPANNDLLLREARALKQFQACDAVKGLRPYVTWLADSFAHRDASTGIVRQTNVHYRLDGFYALTQVRSSFPAGGIDPRHAAWIFRRILRGLGALHSAGIVHGAITPDHVMILPKRHGVTLIDLCYSTIDPGGTVPAIVPRWRDLYPSEVLERQPAGPATDLFMATKTMAWLLAEHDVMTREGTSPLRSFFAGVAQPRIKTRPQDAWSLLEELDDLLFRMWGPRTFQPFALPDEATA